MMQDEPVSEEQFTAWKEWQNWQQQQQQQSSEEMMDDNAPPPEDMGNMVILDIASSIDPGISNFIHRWLAALNDAFPELAVTWTLLLQDMDAVAQYCVQHYANQQACLLQEPDERGALVVTQENNEFLPGLSAHDLFNQNSVSRATRQHMVSYTQCMFSLVNQWSGEAIAAEYEAGASAPNAEQQQQQQQQPKHPDANRHSTARYADLFNYLLERTAQHETIDTGVPALNDFLVTATGQWASVFLVRHLCSVHTDILCELCQFIEQRLHVNVGDRGVWTPGLLPVLMRKAVGFVYSATRRAEAWAWFENWAKWFGPGSPVAFVSRAEYCQNGGRGILCPDTFCADVRAVLVTPAAGDALAYLRLSHAEVIDTFDRLSEAWARDDEASVSAILTAFMELPSVQSAFKHWAVPPGGADAPHAAGGGGGGGASSNNNGRQSQREASLARCRQRAYASSSAVKAGGGGNGSSLAPPDTRTIDELMAMIGETPPSVPNGGSNSRKSKSTSSTIHSKRHKR